MDTPKSHFPKASYDLLYIYFSPSTLTFKGKLSSYKIPKIVGSPILKNELVKSLVKCFFFLSHGETICSYEQ